MGKYSLTGCLIAFSLVSGGCGSSVDDLAGKGNELIEEGKEIANSEGVQDVIEQGADVVNKVQEVDATATNVVSSVSPKVQVIKNMSIEYGETSFTYNDLFKETLEHPEWKLEEANGGKFVTVTGGMKEPVISHLMNSEDAGPLNDSLVSFSDELFTVTFVFPFGDNKILPTSEISGYWNFAGTTEEFDALFALDILSGIYSSSQSESEQ
ncbi:hypothetical protein [Domibacillus enclensis]|uniref:Lipoprotein n=1 Tax=Domibacillus enclensis TaxID=1017273 RepID=A0A1N7C596_9BACI|nr:hypothetical protein [Domibacillus enclensis]OXS74243.1 hypothetical protein B1B05_17375 [Domibacillus enclensis]SIR58643.1 hypothetical protein SAMN05443094_11172 [Domibacillus enclensis]